MTLRKAADLAIDVDDTDTAVLSGKAAVRTAGANTNSRIWYSPILTVANTGINRGTTINQCRATYMGKAPERLSGNLSFNWFVNQVAAATVAEWAIATGTPVQAAGTNLTVKAAGSSLALWNGSTGQKSLNVNIPESLGITPGTDIWALYMLDSAVAQLRVSDHDNEGTITGQGHLLVRAAFQPSLNIGGAAAFSLDISGATVPLVALGFYG